MPIGVVETEELGALELEAAERPPPASKGARISSSVRIHTGTTIAATVSAPILPTRCHSASTRFTSPMIST